MDYIDNLQVSKLLRDKESAILRYMKDAFISYAKDSSLMVPKIYLNTDHGDFRAMPAKEDSYAMIKWISVFPENSQRGLPTINGTLLLSDACTGAPVATMDCGELTAQRTAAVSALAASHACNSSLVKTLTFIGCGGQAEMHLRFYKHVFPNVEVVQCYDPNKSAVLSFIDYVSSIMPHVNSLYCESLKRACQHTDIITTLTPSRTPILGIDDIEHPFHINAIGADAVGKRELKGDLWPHCFLIVDDAEQAFHSGEAQYLKELPYLLLSDIITGAKSFPGQTTVFDSTGLAIEDLAIAKLIYEEWTKT